MTSIARGATMSVRTAVELGRLWYGDRLRDDWAPKTVERMESIFAACGLAGDFWSVS